jgi:hypothetical protein
MRTRVFTRLQMPSGLRLDAQLVDGTSISENAPSVRMLVCFMPAFKRTDAFKEPTKLSAVRNQIEISLPADLAEDTDVAVATKGIADIRKLEVQFPGAAEQLGNVRKGIELCLTQYANGQRLHKGKWITLAAYRGLKGKDQMGKFESTTFTDDTMREFYASYKEALALVRDAPELQRDLRAKAMQKVKVIVSDAPVRMYSSISEIVTQLGLNAQEKAELLLLIYRHPNIDYAKARSIVEDLTPLAPQSPEAKQVVDDWQKETASIDKLSTQVKELAGNLKAQATKAASPGELVTTLKAASPGATAKAEEIAAQIDPKKPSPNQALLKSQAELLALVADATQPAEAVAQGRIFAARTQLIALQRKVKRYDDSPLKESLSAVCDRIASMGGDAKWYSRLVAKTTAEAIK